MTRPIKWMIALAFSWVASPGMSQTLVITARDGIQFTAGVDSVYYNLRWKNSIAFPLRQGMKSFFVVTKGDSAVFQKKIPSLNEIHHFVLEQKENSNQVALFYRGLLSAVPDTVELVREKTSIALQKAKSTLPSFNRKDTSPVSVIPTPPSELSTQESDQSLHRHNRESPTHDLKEPPNIVPAHQDTTQTKPKEENPLPNAFASVVSAVKQAEFEFEKIMLLRGYITEHKTNTEELKIFAGLLTYDLTRLQLLKEAFPYTLDKFNYRNLISVFDFELSKQTFENFIKENDQQ